LHGGVEFTAVDNPRTTAALQAAKARGVRLGNPNLSEAAAIGRARLQDVARERDANVLPVIRELQAAGAASHNAIAGKLNARNVPTARGRKWSHVQVAAVLARSAD
jgi:DNA invertase Pin-like site-specific DNA recombinase